MSITGLWTCIDYKCKGHVRCKCFWPVTSYFRSLKDDADDTSFQQTLFIHALIRMFIAVANNSFLWWSHRLGAEERIWFDRRLLRPCVSVSLPAIALGACKLPAVVLSVTETNASDKALAFLISYSVSFISFTTIYDFTSVFLIICDHCFDCQLCSIVLFCRAFQRFRLIY